LRPPPCEGLAVEAVECRRQRRVARPPPAGRVDSPPTRRGVRARTHWRRRRGGGGGGGGGRRCRRDGSGGGAAADAGSCCRRRTGDAPAGRVGQPRL